MTSPRLEQISQILIGHSHGDNRPLDYNRWFEELSDILGSEGFSLRKATYSVRDLVNCCDQQTTFITTLKTDGGDIRAIIVKLKKKRISVTIIDPHGIQRRYLTTAQLAELLGVSDKKTSLAWGVLMENRPYEKLRSTKKNKALPHKRLGALLRTETQSIRIIVLYALAIGLLSLATPLTVQSLVNSIAFSTLIQPLMVLTLLLLVGLSLAGGLRVLETIVIEFLQRRLFVRTTSDIAHRLARVTLKAAKHYDLRKLTNHFLEVAAIQKLLSSLLLEGVGLGIQMLVGLIVLSFYHPSLLIFALILIASLIFILRFIGKYAIHTAVHESKAKYEVLAWLQQMGGYARVFKTSQRSNASIKQADRLTQGYLDARREHFSRVIRQIIGLVSLQAISSAALLGLGGWLVIKGELTLGQLVASEIIVTAVVGGLAKFGKHLESYYDLNASIDKMGYLIDLPCEHQLISSAIDNDAILRTDELVIGLDKKRAIGVSNFSLAPKTVAAISSDYGSDMSLLLNTLTGDIPPLKGDLILAKKQLYQWPKHELDQYIRLLDEPIVISDTIFENIRFFDEAISEKEVCDIIHSMGASSLIQSLPDGIHTSVKNSTTVLSFDLKVVIAIAREILSPPALLLVDGFLDSVSPRLRQTILKALRTHELRVLIATHLPDIAYICDQTIILKPIIQLANQSIEEEKKERRSLEDIPPKNTTAEKLAKRKGEANE